MRGEASQPPFCMNPLSPPGLPSWCEPRFPPQGTLGATFSLGSPRHRRAYAHSSLPLSLLCSPRLALTLTHGHEFATLAFSLRGSGGTVQGWSLWGRVCFRVVWGEAGLEAGSFLAIRESFLAFPGLADPPDLSLFCPQLPVFQLFWRPSDVLYIIQFFTETVYTTSLSFLKYMHFYYTLDCIA